MLQDIFEDHTRWTADFPFDWCVIAPMNPGRRCYVAFSCDGNRQKYLPPQLMTTHTSITLQLLIQIIILLHNTKAQNLWTYLHSKTLPLLIVTFFGEEDPKGPSL